MKKYFICGFFLATIPSFGQSSGTPVRGDRPERPPHENRMAGRDSLGRVPAGQMEDRERRRQQRDSMMRMQDGQMENRGRRRPQPPLDKTTFLIQRMELTPEEGKSFTTLYKEYITAVELIRPKDTLLTKNPSELTDKETQKLLDQRMTFKGKEIKVMKTYDKKFKAILPLKKVYLLHVAEDQFELERFKRQADTRPGPGRRDNPRMNQDKGDPMNRNMQTPMPTSPPMINQGQK